MVTMKSRGEPERKKAIFAWCMYDWANSAFATTALAAVLPVYFVSLVPEEGVLVRLGLWNFTTTASALWAHGIFISLLVTALSAPILGALADL